MSYLQVYWPVTKFIWFLSQSASLIEPSLKYLHAQDAEYNEEKQKKEQDIY